MVGIPYAHVVAVARDDDGWFQVRVCPVTGCDTRVLERLDADSKPIDNLYAAHYDDRHAGTCRTVNRVSGGGTRVCGCPITTNPRGDKVCARGHGQEASR
jgi:hypothetical protein